MRSRTVLTVALATGLTACSTEPPPMTRAEALEALTQAARSSRGEAATQEPITVSTDFTIGAALEAAAEQIGAWWESQAPCTTVTLTGATTRIDFGDGDDDCTFQGRTYGGVAEITVASTAALELEVAHDWYGLHNGDVAVDGGAVVTWSGADGTRNVTTTHTFTDLEDGTTVEVDGEHTWGFLDPARPLLGGYTLEGSRAWTAEGDDWHLDMIDLELRLQDPAPQAGTFLVTSPAGKTLDITFERIDDLTIQATLTGTRETLVFHINPLGIPVEVEE